MQNPHKFIFKHQFVMLGAAINASISSYELSDWLFISINIFIKIYSRSYSFLINLISTAAFPSRRL
jgi:hypothetical protein